jgi:hypothetical protein
MSGEKAGTGFRLHWMQGVGAILVIIGIMGAANGAAIGYIWLLLAAVLITGGTVIQAVKARR